MLPNSEMLNWVRTLVIGMVDIGTVDILPQDARINEPDRQRG
jgi:hypothetical protein